MATYFSATNARRKGSFWATCDGECASVFEVSAGKAYSRGREGIQRSFRNACVHCGTCGVLLAPAVQPCVEHSETGKDGSGWNACPEYSGIHTHVVLVLAARLNRTVKRALRPHEWEALLEAVDRDISEHALPDADRVWRLLRAA